MEHERTHSSYKSLYRIKPTLFYLGDIKLPFPINLEMAAVFIVVSIIYHIFLAKILGPLLESLNLVPWIMVLAFSGLTTWLVTKIDAAGKFLPKYLLDIIKYCFRKKYHSFGKKMNKPSRKVQVQWKMGVNDWNSR